MVSELLESRQNPAARRMEICSFSLADKSWNWGLLCRVFGRKLLLFIWLATNLYAVRILRKEQIKPLETVYHIVINFCLRLF